MQIQHSSQFMKARQPRQVGLVVYLMQTLRLRGRPRRGVTQTRDKKHDIVSTFRTQRECSSANVCCGVQIADNYAGRCVVIFHCD